MATAPHPDDALLDEFLASNGDEPVQTWDQSYNKKQCPDCGGLHDQAATECSVCGWRP